MRNLERAVHPKIKNAMKLLTHLWIILSDWHVWFYLLFYTSINTYTRHHSALIALQIEPMYF